jgi:hypothetical protein
VRLYTQSQNGIIVSGCRFEANNQDPNAENLREQAGVVAANGSSVDGLNVVGCSFVPSDGNSSRYIALGNGGTVDGGYIAGNEGEDPGEVGSAISTHSPAGGNGVWVGPNSFPTSLPNGAARDGYHGPGLTLGAPTEQLGPIQETPPDPESLGGGGSAQLYVSDGSADVAGDDGDVVLQVTDSNDTTKEFVLADFSAQ